MLTKQRISIFIALIMVFSVVGFGMATDSVDAAAKKPKKITLKTTSKSVDIKGKATVSVKSVSPKKASKKVSYKSSNKKIATVSKKGVVTGKKKGKVTITVTSKANKKVKKTIKITVKQMKPKVTMPKTATMYTGVKQTLAAKVGPKGVYNKGIKYSTSNKGIATVSSKGVVTPIKAGTVKITATSKENKKYKATTTVTVLQSITGISFAETSLTMMQGDSKTNVATVGPANAFNKAVSYSSNNPSVATVDANGNIKAVKGGDAIITATAKGNTNFKATCAVKVNDNKIPADATGTYALDTSVYDSFKFVVGNGSFAGNMTFTEDDFKDAFGDGDLGFYWFDATTMNNFAGTNFNYFSGSDYLFAKEGTEVDFRAPGLPFSTWHYVPGTSLNIDIANDSNSDYSLKLFGKDSNGNIKPNEFVEIIRDYSTDKDVLTIDRNNRSLEITNVNATTMTAKATQNNGTTIELTLVKDGANYKVTMDSSDITNYGIDVIAYK